MSSTDPFYLFLIPKTPYVKKILHIICMMVPGASLFLYGKKKRRRTYKEQKEGDMEGTRGGGHGRNKRRGTWKEQRSRGTWKEQRGRILKEQKEGDM